MPIKEIACCTGPAASRWQKINYVGGCIILAENENVPFVLLIYEVQEHIELQ